MTLPEEQIHTESPFAELVRDAARPKDPTLQRVAFLEKLDERLEPARTRSVWSWMYVPALAVAAAIAFVLWPAAALDYEVAGATSEGGYLRASSSAPATVQFSDGTSIVADAGTRLRLDDVESNGARISVEEGRVVTHVIHKSDTNWSFLAGPFSVRVTGTRFSLAWDRSREVLEVTLTEGSVEIDGFGRQRPVVVAAGQRFVGDAKTRSLLVVDVNHAAPADESAVAPSDTAPTSAVAGVSPPSAKAGSTKPGAAALTPEPHAKANAPSIPWSRLIAEGKFTRVVDEAKAGGTDHCWAACSAADLTALADAARYTGQNRLSEAALEALRQRFGAQGGRSAYMLGRLAESEGRSTEARRWYETSLSEAPNGSFANEALAGKMRVSGSPVGK